LQRVKFRDCVDDVPGLGTTSPILNRQSRSARPELALASFLQTDVKLPTQAQKSRRMFLQQRLLRWVRTPDFRYHVKFLRHREAFRGLRQRLVGISLRGMIGS